MVLFKIVRKLHLGKCCYKVLQPFAHKRISCDDCAVSNARTILQNISPDSGKSCLRLDSTTHENQVYDLQVIIPAYNTGRLLKDALILCWN